MRHSRDLNELLEVLADEPRPVVRYDPGSRFRALLLRSLPEDLHYFDFLRGDEEHQRQWGAEGYQNMRILLFPK